MAEIEIYNKICPVCGRVNMMVENTITGEYIYNCATCGNGEAYLDNR